MINYELYLTAVATRCPRRMRLPGAVVPPGVVVATTTPTLVVVAVDPAAMAVAPLAPLVGALQQI
jgi:hypothetical protein